MRRSLVWLGIALALLAGCFLSLMAGGIAGGVVGYLTGRWTAHAALPTLRQEFALPGGPWEEGPEQWLRPPESWESLPEEMLRPFAWQLSAALITEVEPSDPADEAGVEVGDVIIAVDNTSMDEAHDLSNLTRRHAPGDEVVLTVLRRGEPTEVKQIEVTLGRDRDEEGEEIAYLGLRYQSIRVGMPTTPRDRGRRD